MKTDDSIIKDCLNDMQSAPGAGLRARVIESAMSGAAVPIRTRRTLGARKLLVLAVFAVFCLATTVVYGEDIVRYIRRTVFEHQTEEGTVVSIIRVGPEGTVNSYYSIEEARQAGSFDLKEPLFLPEGAKLLRADVDFTDSPDGKQAGEIFLYYQFPRANGSGFDQIILIQKNIVYIDLISDDGAFERAELIMPGDVEGADIIIVSDVEAKFSSVDFCQTLHWKQDGYAYSMQVFSTTLDKETIIAIAESMK